MSRIGRTCALVVIATLAGCTPRQPSSPVERHTWEQSAFPPALLSKVESGTISYAGGDGSSPARAVVILGASGSGEGVPAEYLWIARQLGIPGRDWQRGQQALIKEGDRRMDAITVEVADSGSRTYYFDISDFFFKNSRMLLGDQKAP